MKKNRRTINAFVRQNRKGLALVEAVLALGLFAMAAFVLTQSTYNCVLPLTAPDSDAIADEDIERAIEAIIDVSDYDSLNDEIEIDALDGDKIYVSGEAHPTQVLDLFELDVIIRSKRVETLKKVFLIRPDWYEIASHRDDILRDRTDFLEEKRRNDEREGSR